MFICVSHSYQKTIWKYISFAMGWSDSFMSFYSIVSILVWLYYSIP